MGAKHLGFPKEVSSFANATQVLLKLSERWDYVKSSAINRRRALLTDLLWESRAFKHSIGLKTLTHRSHILQASPQSGLWKYCKLGCSDSHQFRRLMIHMVLNKSHLLQTSQ